ncbi:MAG: Ribosomal protein S12 methylthiotransferase RimO [Candidatus Methanogaster sp.]|nr:MAG: Ribosomal protein S12 methylthiotransferase RimO [ANME-2 cluster archaeon]
MLIINVLLLASPDVQHDFDFVARIPNLGITSIAGNINDVCDVKIVDLNVTKDPHKFVREAIQKYHIDLVGLSCMSFQYAGMLEIAKTVKECDSGILVVFGGYHPTLEYKELAESPDLEYIDFITRGEGEGTFRELVEAIPDQRYDQVLGLSYKDKETGGMVHNPPRPLLDLADIRLPDRGARLIKKGFYGFCHTVDVVETSRGCTQGCKFCSIDRMYGRSFRTYEIDRVIADIQDAKDHGAENIFFVDDNITLNTKRMKRLCEAIIDAGLDDIYYQTQASTSGIAKSKEVVDLMAKAGFDGVFLGIENALPRNIELFGKTGMASDSERAVRYLHEHKIIVSGGIISGNPDDTKEDILRNFDLAKKLKLDVPIFYIMTPYPKTVLREELIEMGLVTNTDDVTKYDGIYANVKTRHMSTDELQHLIWKMNIDYYDLSWYLSNNIIRRYPKWYLKRTLELIPKYTKRRMQLLLGRKTERDFYEEDMKSGELCKGGV